MHPTVFLTSNQPLYFSVHSEDDLDNNLTSSNKEQTQPPPSLSSIFLLFTKSCLSSLTLLSFTAIEMASNSSKFSYQRLKQEAVFHDEDQVRQRSVIERTRSSSWPRVRKVHIRRRLKIRIPRLKRFLRRKAMQVRVGLGKVVKRLKESQAHFGDLFSGNYLFMQITPPSLEKTYNGHFLYGGFSSKCKFSRDSTMSRV